MASRQGKPEEELFLSRPMNGEDSPTVEPLRINKPNSPNPRADSAASNRFNYPPPSSSSKLSFPLPPGASSSASPLPYPDDEDLYSQPVEPRKQRLPYPDDSKQKPNRTGSGGSGKAQERPSPSRTGTNDTTPRLSTSPVDKRGPGLAERRGTAPKPLPESPGPDLPDKEGLFAKQPRRDPKPSQGARRPSQTGTPSYPEFRQQYYPPPVPGAAELNGTSAENPNLNAPSASAMNRFASTASTSTTRATRGSPPPPETPIIGPGEQAGGGIEARYAAAGISGTATLSSLQAQNAAAAQRSNQYGPPPVPQLPQSPGFAPNQQQNIPRPWTPTESPDNQPHGPPTVYQGPNQVTASSSPPRQQGTTRPGSQPNALEQDFQRMQLSPSPPPAYSSVTPGVNGNAQYPQEKRTNVPAAINTAPRPNIASPLTSPALQHPGHPAFANDPREEPAHPLQQQQPVQQAATTAAAAPVQQFANSSPFQGAGPTSPPPLPEGWIAHLDQNSGQYYYIHLPTQATQWEFPKGPTPLNHPDAAPLSPTVSTYGNPLASPGLSAFGKTPLGSPGFPPHTPGYAESIMSMASQTPTAAGFSGPPPSAGVDMYKVAPTNGVYFGPYLRYVNMDFERGVWLGTIMLVTDAPQPPTIHIHQSVDLSPNPRQLKPNPIFTHQRWTFYRYDVDLQMGEGPSDKWTYAITSHLGCTRYEFLVAGRYETNWRFIAHSGNDFAMNTSVNERSKLGGIGFMWKDILQKNVECGGFHVQLGLGDQIYGDRLWKEIPLLKQWLAMSGKDNRKSAAWTARHEEDVSHAYFHYYTSHFDQPYLREAFAQIPHILQIDDHDIFDGFGSYPEYMQSSNMFKNIGRIGIEMYLLFQHHTTLEILRNVSTDIDLFTITGTGWHFVKYLGPAVVVVGPDCRSERNQRQVLAGPTYQGIFPKVATLPPSVQHCMWMVSVPIVYPRLDTVESIAQTISTAKKGVTGTYNLLGKVTSSVAGVVGGKEAVASGFSQVKKAVGKSGLMGGVLNTFGDIDIADELRDMWTHESKDLERTYLIRTLQGIGHQKGIRMTFLSGDVNCCGAGLLHDPSHPSDHKTMYQVISSAVVAAPPPSYVLKMLHNNKPLYVPQNGQKTTNQVSDTKEDMMEIFQTDTNGGPREMKKLMGRRNYVAFVAYDPEAIAGSANPYAGSVHNGQQGLAKLSLAVDFVVQGDGGFSPPTKYGPVIIPSLEFGR
ncbi:related to WW domain protein [Phialocephala subalpina]|uniref:Related to WW domain protein n=1 Tax=Phialocephala subalpina TaxID=576137 RepID=A0A1L7WD94_9HELO|nr:related to WW domain protein [Phialocephala subalpina]